jgi:hypothetical protein
VVRSPDLTTRGTEGLPVDLLPALGDLRSRRRRGLETRAEQRTEGLAPNGAPDSGAASVNYDFGELLARAEQKR